LRLARFFRARRRYRRISRGIPAFFVSHFRVSESCSSHDEQRAAGYIRADCVSAHVMPKNGRVGPKTSRRDLVVTQRAASEGAALDARQCAGDLRKLAIQRRSLSNMRSRRRWAFTRDSRPRTSVFCLLGVVN